MDLLDPIQIDQIHGYEVVNRAAIQRRFIQKLRDGLEGGGNDEFFELHLEIRLEEAQHHAELLKELVRREAERIPQNLTKGIESRAEKEKQHLAAGFFLHLRVIQWEEHIRRRKSS